MHRPGQPRGQLQEGVQISFSAILVKVGPSSPLCSRVHSVRPLLPPPSSPPPPPPPRRRRRRAARHLDQEAARAGQTGNLSNRHISDFAGKCDSGTPWFERPPLSAPLKNFCLLIAVQVTVVDGSSPSIRVAADCGGGRGARDWEATDPDRSAGAGAHARQP